RSGEIATARLLTVPNLQAAAASRVGLPHGSGTLPSPPDCCTLSAPTADLTPELLHFFSADEFNEYTSAAQKVWRDGIRSLMAHVYEKGVKVASRMYHAGYKFDFKTVFEDAWWDSHELSKLSIEPSKMRYV